MKQLVILSFLLVWFPAKGIATVYSSYTDKEKNTDPNSGEGIREIHQNKPIQVDARGELWIRIEADRSMTLYTKDGQDIVNYDHIDPQTIWGGYYFFIFRKEEKHGMFMYRDKKY